MDRKITGRVAGLMVVGAVILSACGSSGATTAPASVAPATAAPASAAPASQAAGKVTLGVAFPNSDTFLSRVQDGMKAEADRQGRHSHDHRRQGRHRGPAEPGRELRLAEGLGDHRRPGRHQRRAADGGRRQGREHPDRVRQPQPVDRGRSVRRLRLPVRGHGRDGGARQARRRQGRRRHPRRARSPTRPPSSGPRAATTSSPRTPA